MGYFLDAEDIKKLADMIAAGDGDEVIAAELKVTRPTVAYRRKKLAEQGANEFLPPALVRRIGAIKSHATRRGERVPETADVLDVLTRSVRPDRLISLSSRAGVAGADSNLVPMPKAKPHKRHCLTCGGIFETFDRKNQHRCDPCRNSTNSEGDEPFGNFVVYG
jgi:hypothetical protein